MDEELQPLPRLSLGTNQYETLAFPIIWMFTMIIRDLILERLNPRIHFTALNLFILDYLVFVIPQLLAFTYLADYFIEFIWFLFCFTLFVKFCFAKNKEIAQQLPQSDMYTYLRAFVQISTDIAILGVDFRIFPRRFAKTISYGTSPMDFGTSMFVFAMGLSIGLFKKDANFNYSKKSILQFIYSMAALILLGFGKPLLMSLFKYRHELTEYGTHWNFFMTLAALKFVSFLPSIFTIIFGIVGSILLASQRDFENYLLSDNRNYDSIVDSNREGIVSLFGYILILEISRRFASDLKNLFGGNIASWKSAAFSLLSTASYYSIYYFVTVYLDLQPSRRIANLPYILQCLGASHFATGIFQIAMLLSPLSQKNPPQKLPTLCDFIGSWSLTTFLIANILTGIINVSIQTDQIQSKFLQFVILSGYTFTLSGIIQFICCSNFVSKFKFKNA